VGGADLGLGREALSATLPDDGPTGGFVRDDSPLPRELSP
jgi:hypothetical protein